MCESFDLNGMFGVHFAEITHSDLLDEFIKKYKPEFPNDESRECAVVLSLYYSNQQLPLCGMLNFMKMDFNRFIRTGDCRQYRLWKKAQEPKKEDQRKHDQTTHGPDWRGPNGTWSLD